MKNKKKVKLVSVCSQLRWLRGEKEIKSDKERTSRGNSIYVLDKEDINEEFLIPC